MLKSLIFKSIRKDFSSATVRILMLALLIAVASVTSIGFFTDRVSAAMQLQATQLLGADLLVTSSKAIPKNVYDYATQSGIKVATTVTFPSVVLTDDDESKLVSVKAVSDQYPLYGELKTYPILEKASLSTKSGIPDKGAVYLDPSLRSVLNLKPDSKLALGRIELSLAAEIDSEPDRSGSLFQLAPRVMMNNQDLEASGLLIEGSRANYALLVAGSKEKIAEFRLKVETLGNTEFEFRDPNNANRQVKRVLNQINMYFGLAATLAVLLSGAAIAISARQYAAQQATSGAILRAMGLERRVVTYWIIFRLLCIAVVALMLGLALGYLTQYILTSVLGSWFSIQLPQAGWTPALSGVAVTLLCLIGFASLPVLQAGAVPVLSVLRRQMGGVTLSNRLFAGLGAVTVALIMYLQSRQLLLVLILLAGLLIMFIVFALAGKFLYQIMRLLVPDSWSTAKYVLRRRTDIAVLQLSIFGLIIMAMLLIWIVRQDVLQEWQQQLPSDVPDRFLVNVQPSQKTNVEKDLTNNFLFNGELSPVVRGRLLTVNGEDVNKRYAGKERAQGYLHHEFNLSFSDNRPEHNVVVRGKWWQPGTDQHLLSLERRFARRLELKIGDELEFQVAGSNRSAKIANIREVEWESFNVNFFVITSHTTLSELPHTYIASFRQGEISDTLTADLVRQNPGLTVIEVDKIIDRVRSIVDRASLGVQAVFMFTILAGFIVLLAAVQGNLPERMQEIAILRSMGASHRKLKQGVIVEFATIGGIAGLLAALFATVTASLVATHVMHFTIQTNSLIWFYGTMGGSITVGLAGYLACRKVLNKPPLSVLQRT